MWRKLGREGGGEEREAEGYLSAVEGTRQLL